MSVSHEKVNPASNTKGALALSPELQRAAEELLFRQVELLDGKQWQDYIDLFADDGIYWMPADQEQTHWDGVPSIFAEDHNLMMVRMKRLQHPDAWSQKPQWYTSHVVGNVTLVEQPAPGEVIVRSRFHMMELRRDSTRHFAGRYLHHLIETGQGLRIKLQRVDLVNGCGAFDYVLLAWI